MLYGPLMVFYGSPRILPRDLGGVETPAQRRITRSSPPSSHSLNFTLSLNAISPDLPRSFPSAHKETPLKRIIFFENRLENISRGGIFFSFQSRSLHSLNSVLTRLGGICLDPAKSRVTVGEKAWEAVSFPWGGAEVFFGQNMRSGQKVGQQVLLWVAHVGKSLAQKADRSCVKRGQ